MINLTNKKQAWIDELFLAPMTALNKQAGAGDVNPKTYYIHPAAFGSTKDPGYGHVPVVKADDFENLRAKLEAAEKRIAELEGGAFNPAILDVVAERQRQKTIEGWTPEHDDEHCNGELAMAAVCYINETGTVNRNGGKPWGWPWDASWWKPKTRRRNLVKAGALILAEIERLDRDAGIGVKGD